MKNSLTLITIILLISCDDDQNSFDKPDIEGKWNLETYIDIDGDEHLTTYSIFNWYEQGFEFISGEEFYPRYDPKSRFDTEIWQTDYEVGPGKYFLSNGILTLSHEDQIYDYGFRMKDTNTIEISNDGTRTNAWTGTWILRRSN
ncbi:hypothetical protein [Flagellimonas sp. GZD32]|uniref:hypothetical protein n=1 Tax=Flagellimonas cixiensis TaxID=3228750 RepID=UPI0035C87EF0